MQGAEWFEAGTGRTKRQLCQELKARKDAITIILDREEDNFTNYRSTGAKKLRSARDYLSAQVCHLNVWIDEIKTDITVPALRLR